jgi:hypothetical protein
MATRITRFIELCLWGFTKLADIVYIDLKCAGLSNVGVFIVGIITLSTQFQPATDMKAYRFTTGAAYGIGCLFYFIAADKGKNDCRHTNILIARRLLSFMLL